MNENECSAIDGRPWPERLEIIFSRRSSRLLYERTPTALAEQKGSFIQPRRLMQQKPGGPGY
jgi:hypothetical protein